LRWFADLLGKMSGERSRWDSQLSELDDQLGQLPVAALLLAAFITYLPAHPEDVREKVLPAWAR
jgi:dynein heavy chain 2